MSPHPAVIMTGDIHWPSCCISLACNNICMQTAYNMITFNIKCLLRVYENSRILVGNYIQQPY
jgi:hypothetical protein